MRKAWTISAILATTLSGTVALAQAQDSSTAQNSTTVQDNPNSSTSPDSSNAQGSAPSVNTTTHQGPTLGGHFGFAFPLMTDSRGNWTNDVANQFSITFPAAITVKGSGRLAFDLELDPTINTTGTRATTLAGAPGLIYGLAHRWALGTRLAFNVNASSWGIVPFMSHSRPMKREGDFFKTYFIEGDFPVLFNRTVGACVGSVHVPDALPIGFLSASPANIDSLHENHPWCESASNHV